MTAGEWVQPVRRGYLAKCCDCGSVHRVNFRIRDGRVQLQAFRKGSRRIAYVERLALRLMREAGKVCRLTGARDYTKMADAVARLLERRAAPKEGE